VPDDSPHRDIRLGEWGGRAQQREDGGEEERSSWRIEDGGEGESTLFCPFFLGERKTGMRTSRSRSLRFLLASSILNESCVRLPSG
jgi:hypothetical protein